MSHTDHVVTRCVHRLAAPCHQWIFPMCLVTPVDVSGRFTWRRAKSVCLVVAMTQVLRLSLTLTTCSSHRRATTVRSHRCFTCRMSVCYVHWLNHRQQSWTLQSTTVWQFIITERTRHVNTLSIEWPTWLDSLIHSRQCSSAEQRDVGNYDRSALCLSVCVCLCGLMWNERQIQWDAFNGCDNNSTAPPQHTTSSSSNSNSSDCSSSCSSISSVKYSNCTCFVCRLQLTSLFTFLHGVSWLQPAPNNVVYYEPELPCELPLRNQGYVDRNGKERYIFRTVYSISKDFLYTELNCETSYWVNLFGTNLTT